MSYYLFFLWIFCQDIQASTQIPIDIPTHNVLTLTTATNRTAVKMSSEDVEDLQGQMMHGFRMGFGYVNVNPAESDVLHSQWLYLLGYEINQRVIGGSWINVLFAQNISLIGVNQGLFIPSGNLLLGFELHERIQLLSGINLVPDPGAEAEIPVNTHMIAAIGWTPKVGQINVPFHVIMIPDVHTRWRGYITTGVNW